MKEKITLISEDRFLCQKLKLILDGYTVEMLIDEALITGSPITLIDMRGYGENRLELVGGGSVALPFLHSEIRELISSFRSGSRARLTLDKASRLATLDREDIKLTEVEARLLDCLLSAGGEYVDRATLTSSVWGEGANEGVLNVYIHYLREKLEARGEKIILSSRKLGYKIDAKYLEGVRENA